MRVPVNGNAWIKGIILDKFSVLSFWRSDLDPLLGCCIEFCELMSKTFKNELSLLIKKYKMLLLGCAVCLYDFVRMLQGVVWRADWCFYELDDALFTAWLLLLYYLSSGYVFNPDDYVSGLSPSYAIYRVTIIAVIINHDVCYSIETVERNSKHNWLLLCENWT